MMIKDLPMSWIIGMLGVVWSVTACKTGGTDRSDVKFGWDEDLSPSAPACGDTLANAGSATPTPQTTSPVSVPEPSSCQLNKPGVIDPQFCAGQAPGTCFSLILRIPTKELLTDLGLNALSLGAQPRDTSLRLQEICQSTWQAYHNQYKNNLLYATRRKFVSNIQKMRCLFNFISEEYLAEDAKLADNEIGFSVRLTSLSVDGINRATTINALTLDAATTQVTIGFRNAYIFAGSKLSGGGTPWKSIPGFGYAPYSVSRNFDNSIHWNFSLETLMSSLSSINLSSLTDQTLKSFVTRAKTVVNDAMTGKTPPTSALILVGMGYNTLKRICGESNQHCQTTRTIASKLNSNTTMGEFVPSSEVNEVFRMGLIKGIGGILDTILTTATPGPLEKTLGIESLAIPSIE